MISRPFDGDLRGRVIHRSMRREAAAMAFYDVPRPGADVLSLCLLLWIMRRPPKGGAVR
jgi:hypothetical protein